MLNLLDNGRVLVVGDVMLDRYVHGHASRLSPEAPVPVLKWAQDQEVVGGAGNVAANIAALGGAVGLAGVVGVDEGARRLSALLHAYGPHLQTFFAVHQHRPTTLKTRFVTNGQQLLRLDVEDARDIEEDCEADLLDLVAQQIPQCDVVVLSDYKKGVLTSGAIRRVIQMARHADRPVIVDPKQPDWTVYTGATIITPNRAELQQATGRACETDEEVESAARDLGARVQASILVTRSERGMTLVEVDEPVFHIPTHAREVFDVSGAGDTVVAVLAAGLAAKMTLHQAVRIANVAAGLVVAKHGTATLTPAELNRALRKIEPQHAGIASTQQAVLLREMWREQGLKVGFTNGCFDIVHPGHIKLFEQAAAACDRLIVALNSDASVKRLKGPKRPIQDELSRATVIGALSSVSSVVLFDEDTPLDMIKALRPDVLVKGADYTEDQVVGGEFVKSLGGKVLLAVLNQGHSTTSIVARSQQG